MRNTSSLIVCVFVLILLIVDLEVAQFVRVPRRRDHTQPVTKVVLLQVLLRQVLQVPSTEYTELETTSAVTNRISVVNSHITDKYPDG